MSKIVDNTNIQMKKVFESLLTNFSKITSGKASASILDGINVNYYGQPTPLKQLCKISIPQARLIVIQPWDKAILKEIEKSILSSNLGITPENDGIIIRLPFAPLTHEKRIEIVKDVKKRAEGAKIAIRNLRRDFNDETKEQEKESLISEDDQKKILKSIQEKTDLWIEKITQASQNKEKDILTV